MEIGDLVRNKNSESGMLGVLTGWKTIIRDFVPHTYPVVAWQDGRVSPIRLERIEKVEENERQ